MFADQAVIAIENARLFEEIQAKGRELAAANAQLAEATAHKSAFISSMSHELRTPLNAILGYSELLQEEAEDLGAETMVADLGKVNAAGKHLLLLINNILDLSKIEAGKMDLYVEEFSIAGLLAEVEAVAVPLMEKNANTFRITTSRDVGMMRADLTKVRQSLLNLLSNAAKFTERGAVSLSARRETDAEDGRESLSFAVTDTGIGMTQEQQGRLFEVFSQAEASTSKQFGGTGLGLALSREFCRLMGGDIGVSSTLGQGSTFTIHLPAAVGLQ